MFLLYYVWIIYYERKKKEKEKKEKEKKEKGSDKERRVHLFYLERNGREKEGNQIFPLQKKLYF